MVEIVKTETKYRCGQCRCEYPTKEEAEACEKKVSKNVHIGIGRSAFNDWNIGTVFAGGNNAYDHEILRVVAIHQSAHAHIQYPECETTDGHKTLMWSDIYGRRLTPQDIARLREFADLAERQI